MCRFLCCSVGCLRVKSHQHMNSMHVYVRVDRIDVDGGEKLLCTRRQSRGKLRFRSRDDTLCPCTAVASTDSIATGSPWPTIVGWIVCWFLGE